MNHLKKSARFLLGILLVLAMVVTSVPLSATNAYAGGWGATILIKYITLESKYVNLINDTELTSIITQPDGSTVTGTMEISKDNHGDHSYISGDCVADYTGSDDDWVEGVINGPEAWITPAVGTYSISLDTIDLPAGYKIDDTLGIGEGTSFPLSVTFTQEDVDTWADKANYGAGHEDYIIYVPVKKQGTTSPVLNGPFYDSLSLEVFDQDMPVNTHLYVELYSESSSSKFDLPEMYYEFQYATSKNGTYETLTTLPSTYMTESIRLINFTQLGIGKTYWFRCRVGWNIGGKMIYRTYSTPVSAKLGVYQPKTQKLSETSYTYDGKIKDPSVIIEDGILYIPSSWYEITKASGRKKVGTYEYTITYNSEYYTGTKTLSFKINPKGTTLSSVKALKKSFKVTWKKQSTQTTGYQIRYSTKSTMAGAKTATITKNSTTTSTIKNLTAKKKYYVQIRTYKTVSGTKYYSSWSAKKTVTTK